MTPGKVAIYAALGRFDMRKSFDGLAELVREHIAQDPRSGALFLFFNRSCDRVKVLWWDRNGYCLLYKRLEKGRFEIPKPAGDASHLLIDAQALARLLQGLSLEPPQQLAG